jgi:hypothetical protein
LYVNWTGSKKGFSSSEMKAQLSFMTKVCLDITGGFEVVERGEIFVKGKGAMKTYWLLGEFGKRPLRIIVSRNANSLNNGFFNNF